MADANDPVPSWSVVDAPAEIDLRTDIPHSARMYDYFLGGKDNFPADREAAEKVLAAFPDARTSSVQNRLLMQRVARFLVGEAGVRQFLDIGTGIPTSPNLHEVIQQAAPDSRVVYIDNDPIVLAHARALLTSDPRGATAYADADLRVPDKILAAPELTATLDLSRPVALSLYAILHFVPDLDDARGIVNHLVDALSPGSYLAVSHATVDFLAPDVAADAIAAYRDRGIPFTPRTREEIATFFEGLQLVDPGIKNSRRWRPDGTAAGVTDAQVGGYGALARKP